jgi:hypothetical protein
MVSAKLATGSADPPDEDIFEEHVLVLSVEDQVRDLQRGQTHEAEDMEDTPKTKAQRRSDDTENHAVKKESASPPPLALQKSAPCTHGEDETLEQTKTAHAHAVDEMLEKAIDSTDADAICSAIDHAKETAQKYGFSVKKFTSLKIAKRMLKQLTTIAPGSATNTTSPAVLPLAVSPAAYMYGYRDVERVSVQHSMDEQHARYDEEEYECEEEEVEEEEAEEEVWRLQGRGLPPQGKSLSASRSSYQPSSVLPHSIAIHRTSNQIKHSLPFN